MTYQATYLLLGGSNGLGETEEGKREVHEAILVLLQLVLAVDDLVEFEANETRCERSRRRDGRDDLAGDLLRLVSVGRGDAVVERPEVGGRGNEVDVEIRVVVLLKIDRVKPVAGERRGRRKRLGDLRTVAH